MIIHAFGVQASPLELAAHFSGLHVSHVVVSNSLTPQGTPVDVAAQQPAWPIILPSTKTFRRFDSPYDRQILYICGSIAELSHTNLRIIKDWKRDLAQSLRYAVVHPFAAGWDLAVNEMDVAAYVDIATQPSFLNHVQSELYRITPYALRKDVQLLFISYLAGLTGYRKLKEKLDSSHKLDGLRTLLSDPACAELRNAVALTKKVGDVENVAKQTGVQKYEIMYILRSTAKKAI